MDDHDSGSLERGRACSGVATRVEPFGVFVRLDAGPEGFISVPELARRHVQRIEDVVQMGDQVRVKVLDVDLQRGRLYLSLWATVPDPFPYLRALVGQVVVGQVTKIAPIGVFVRIEDRLDGFEGFLPGTDLEGQGPLDVHHLGEGHRVSVTVKNVDIDRRRILLASARE
jgi:ribosomal protein S1